jgi:hypothetical protein
VIEREEGMRNEAEIEDRTVNILAIIRGNESYMKY